MKKQSNHIYVTQPALPDLNEFIPYLEQIWDNKILTNNVPPYAIVGGVPAKIIKSRK